MVLVGTASVAIAGVSSAAYQVIGDVRDRRRYLPPGRLVDVGGRRLHLWQAGEGGPAVVVAPSLGEPGFGWAEIQRRLADHTTVVLYDRAGLGWSDPGPWPTGKRMVDDLHALLHAAAITPPYVLVGHSLGGIVMRLYAAHHPEQVAGLVLVDSSHPEQQRRLPKPVSSRFSQWRWWLHIAKVAFRPLGLVRLRADLRAARGHRLEIPPHLGWRPSAELAEAATAILRNSRQHRASFRELFTFPILAAEAARKLDAEPGSLGQLPLAVITRGADPPPPWPVDAEAVWQKLQLELAALSERSTHLYAKSGDHFVHRTDPELVARAIAELVDQIRPPSQ